MRTHNGHAVTGRIHSVFDAARALTALRARPVDTYNTHAEDAASYKYTLYKQVRERKKTEKITQAVNSTPHNNQGVRV